MWKRGPGPGEQLPGIRPLAEALVISPNTVAKAYRELDTKASSNSGTARGIRVRERGHQETDRQAAGRTGHCHLCHRTPAGTGGDRQKIRQLFEAELAGLTGTGGRSGDRSSSKQPTCEELRKCRGLAGLDVQSRLARFTASSERTAPERPTIKILLGMARPHGQPGARIRSAAETEQQSVEISRRTGAVSEDKDLDGSMTVEEIIRFTGVLPELAGRPRTAVPADVRAPTGPEGREALPRHTNQARAPACPQSRRAAPHARRANLGS